MYKAFNSIDELFSYIREDKQWEGAEATHRNRYPIRFVLFEHFADFYDFVQNCAADNIFAYSIDKLIELDHPDIFPTFTELSKWISEFIKHLPANDYVLYPFSEMTRFYEPSQFSSLVKTIKGVNPPAEGQADHIRVYIPIVGMQERMRGFMHDNHTYVWEYKAPTETFAYNLILAKDTYGIIDIESKYSVVRNLRDWLRLWEKGELVKQTIICTSPNIFKNSHHAHPDNAFSYLECENAHQFLTKGLGLDFGVTEEPGAEEMPHWEELASKIDITAFDFDTFVKERLDTFTLDSGVDFIKAWFDCEDGFDRWLLALYFREISSGQRYIAKALAACTKLTESELFSNIATLIFDEANKEVSISERRKAMHLAKEHNVNITDFARTKLKAKLSAIAASPDQGGYYMAVKLLTSLTDEERELAVEWVGKGKVKPEEVKDVFPSLYSYMQPLGLSSLSGVAAWLPEYIDAYRQSKLANYPYDRVGAILSEKNASPASFQAWRDDFRTVKTVLHNRKDIDVIYWIDGLGIDWVPFIRNIVARYSKEHVYLNEIHIATATLPTKTSVNKAQLLSLLDEGAELPKSGDLDTYAHKAKSYPHYIVEEMEILESSITQLLEDYNGKKIAIVSDHGLTYLSQMSDGMKLAGVQSDHEGRLASITGSLSPDNNYIILDDGKTVCSLTHRSLTDKVDNGHGAHGGCTPEEVLVPIIIISSQKNAKNYSASLVSDEISGTNPVVRFKIKGLSSIDIPTVDYNGSTYHLTNTGGDEFESDRLNLVDTATKVVLRINDEHFDHYNIKVSTGLAEADDMFNF